MSTFAPTPEQVAIVDAGRTGENLVITAGAGTGKTSTLRMIAESLPGRGLYLAYNRAIADDAARMFPRNVQCMTAHAIAYRAVVAGTSRVERLRASRMPPREQALVLGIHGPTRVTDQFMAAPWQLMRLVNGTIRNFCNSADPELEHRHVPKTAGMDDFENHRQVQAVVVPIARKAWDDLAGETGKLPLSHDAYLKVWQLKNPQAKVDYILFDEAQDANPVIAAIVLGQEATQQIAVGDSSQAIYGWRGAKDSLKNWPAQQRLALSRSWRFGPAVADEANKWLTLLDAELRLTGNPGRHSLITGMLPEADAVLCRTNGAAMAEAIDALKNDRRPALVGGGDDLRRLAEASKQLRERGMTTHPELYAFHSWGEVQDYVQDDSGRDLKVAVDLIDEHGADTLIGYLDQLSPEATADVVISTAHKCVHPDILVETPGGLVAIRDIAENGMIATPRGPREYRDKFTKESDQILCLTTKRGYEIRVSPEHGLTVWRAGGSGHQRIEAREIRTGDWLRLRLGSTIDPAAMPALPSPEPIDVLAKHWTLPAFMSSDLAELLGLLVANGTIFAGGKGLRVAKRYDSVIDRMEILVKDLFSYDLIRRVHLDTPCGEIHSTQICRWLLAIGGLAPKAKAVPNVILSSPLEAQAVFLRGLFEDGTVNVRDHDVDHIHWENKDPKLAGIVQTMLLRFGIASTRRTHHGITSLYLYSEHAESFASQIGFIAPEKNRRLHGFSRDRRSLIPLTRSELAPLEKAMSVTDKQNARLRGYVSVAVARKVIAALGVSASGVLPERLGWLYERVNAITLGYGETMCVTVPDGSRFLQNGFDGWNSKGREWNRVRIGDDFRPPKKDDDGKPGEPSPTESMLAYVAVTRAKTALHRGSLDWVDQYIPGSDK